MKGKSGTASGMRPACTACGELLATRAFFHRSVSTTSKRIRFPLISY